MVEGYHSSISSFQLSEVEACLTKEDEDEDEDEYKHFYAKDVSTHPSMVSTHQHRFKGKMCKNVETVSTHVKSVSTRVAVFQKSSLPRSTHSQSRFGTAGRHTQEQVDTGPSSQNSFLHILDSVSTLLSGQTPLKHSKEADPVEDSFGEEFEEDPTSQIAEHRLGLQASQ
ncbi:hypothetical protein Taro_011981, partial [Colocasia esculenta]|nr:hypothetical protein [Colocasia esculenta]